MGKRGPKPKKIINTTWRPNLAYAVGLITSDGYLSCDGLLVDLTSVEIEQLKNYSKCLGVDFKIGEKSSGNGRKALRIQFKNRIFYNFLLSIGLTNKKSLTLNKIDIPPEYFFDFLRGYFDGDGSSYSYWDLRWKSSFMFYLGFSCGSRRFLEWIQKEIQNRINILGHITHTKRGSGCYQLKYAKREAMEIISKMYYSSDVICLSRKRKKIEQTLKVNKRQQLRYV